MEKDEQLNMITTQTGDLEKYWNRRNQVILENRNIVNLVKPEGKQDMSTWTSNEPKVFMDTARTLLSINAPRFRLPILMGHASEEKDRMNKAERLCIGINRALNKKRMDTGGVNWLWDLAYYILEGHCSVFNVVKKTEEGVEFVADIFDPLTVFPQFDSRGMCRCSRTYDVDKITAIAMANEYQEQGLEFDFKEPTSQENVKVINYWLREYKKKTSVVSNAILIDGQIVKPLTVHRKLRKIPISYMTIGVPEKSSSDWAARVGEHIIAANKDIYQYDDELIQLMHEVMKENVWPNRVWNVMNPHAGSPGQMKGYGQDVLLKPGEAVTLMQGSTTPREVEALMTRFAVQKQKGSVPDIVYGNVPVELSGFAISQLMAAIKYKLGPYLNALQGVVSDVYTEFLYQYKNGRFPKIELSTENPHDLKRGMFYIEEFSPQDIPERIYVDVTIPINSQYDKTQAIMNAVQAIQGGVLSRETLWENDLDIQDASQEKERIREDQLFNDPFIMDIEIIERMWHKVEEYEVQGKKPQAEALKRYIMQKEMSLGMRQGIPQKAQAGVPPNQMPPEARPTSRPTPDQIQSFTNQPPSNPGGGQNRGRKGILFSPSGEAIA